MRVGSILSVSFCMNKIPVSKISRISEEFLAGTLKTAKLAAELHITRRTVARRVAKLKRLAAAFPDKLQDLSFNPPRQPREKTQLYRDLIGILPVLVDRAATPCLYAESLWAEYRKIYPQGYGKFWFEHHYRAWRASNQVCRFYNQRVRVISPEDDAILQKWRSAGSREQWKKATVILGSFAGRTLAELMGQVEKTRPTLLEWIENYKNGGLRKLDLQPYTTCPALLEGVRLKQENLTRLLHQAPKLHGFNRTSWRVEDLVTAYQAVYNLPISRSCVLENLHKMGLGYYKSRELLTSPDPDFREKLGHIKHILRNLGEHERFFSVDEYGPFAIKLKTGRSFTRERQTVPQVQKSKGCVVLIAALELSRNQVSHFYSYKKNTDQMIRLLDLLLEEYRDTEKLYLSWDCASFHAAKKLYARRDEINSEAYRLQHRTPLVEFAPLPVSAQFLNVIESVFSGLARAVIHNSNYGSAEECRAAIDRHFMERNRHFREHPRRAGNKIWGQELVAPEFHEGRHTKSLSAMRGAR
ncbi:IS630 family transposase [Mucilaginibacter sp. L3T2-6]|uniref:IS630 family transposase n=1 Tax=Mucilaginibacter sp. L3T2-6 TaxID=3062491 RepID=UPI0026751773|nr:IS630 family transposase [Mucilaginibacter sp. L3T2-6]MDO3641313.1 IS630 family transposase [Mucilaginibacter sp. L3T2-6]MDV6213927.1 IS630 family transposase [Mucilaginibacter sp. L3T2-6]